MSIEQHRIHTLESLTQPPPRIHDPPQPPSAMTSRHNSSRRYALTIDIDSPNERILRAMIASSTAGRSSFGTRTKTSPSNIASARIIPSRLSAPNDIHHTMSSSWPTQTPLLTEHYVQPNFFLSRPATNPPRRQFTLKCAVCFEYLPISPSQSKTPTKRCTHDINVCPGCLERHALTQVVEWGITDIVCPTSMCPEVLSYQDVYAAVKDHMTLERYEYLILRRHLQNVSNFVWCKNPQCSSGQIHEGGVLCPSVLCNACGESSCFVHDMPWHIGLTCNQYDAKIRKTQSETLRANQNYLSKNAKACPNPKCGRMIEKINGCDHMTCATPVGCGHEFCWSCLADYGPIYERGNHYHKRRCRHYDSRVKLAVRKALVWILRL